VSGGGRWIGLGCSTNKAKARGIVGRMSGSWARGAVATRRRYVRAVAGGQG